MLRVKNNTLRSKIIRISDDSYQSSNPKPLPSTPPTTPFWGEHGRKFVGVGETPGDPSYIQNFFPGILLHIRPLICNKTKQ